MRRRSNIATVNQLTRSLTVRLDDSQPRQVIQEKEIAVASGGPVGEPVYPCNILIGSWGPWSATVPVIGFPAFNNDMGAIHPDIFGNAYYGNVVDSGGLVAEFYKYDIETETVTKIGEYSHSDPYDTADLQGIYVDYLGRLTAWGDEYRTTSPFASRVWVYRADLDQGFALPHPNLVDDYFPGSAAISHDGSSIAVTALWQENTNGFNYQALSVNGGAWQQLPMTIISHGSNTAFCGYDENSRLHLLCPYDVRQAHSYWYSDNDGGSWSAPILTPYRSADTRGGSRLLVSRKGSWLFTARQSLFETCFSGSADSGANFIDLSSTMRWPQQINNQVAGLLSADTWGCEFINHIRDYQNYGPHGREFATVVENGLTSPLLGTDTTLQGLGGINDAGGVQFRLQRLSDGSLVLLEYDNSAKTIRHKIRSDQFI